MHLKVPSPLRRINPQRVFFGWWLVGITVFITGLAFGPLLHGAGVFIVALRREFGWSQAILSVPWTLNRAAEGAILGPVEGYMTDRMGTRRMVFIGFLILGGGLISFSFIRSVPGYFVSVAVLWLGAGMAGSIPLMAALNNWFIRRRTTAIAMGQMGGNLGGLLVPLLAGAIEVYGWRVTTFWGGIGVLALAIPISQIIRNRPEQYGLLPDGDLPAQISDSINEGDISDRTENVQVIQEDPAFTVKEALKTTAFWTLSGAMGCAVAAALTIILFIVPSLEHRGISLEIAGTVVATYTAVSVVFRIVGGFIGDRVPKRLALAVFISLQASGVLVVAIMPNVFGAFLFAILFGAGFGGRGPIRVSMLGEYFGRKHFATIMGIASVPTNLTFAVPIAVGWAFDHLGSYSVPFMTLAIINFAGAALALLAKKPKIPTSRL